MKKLWLSISLLLQVCVSVIAQGGSFSEMNPRVVFKEDLHRLENRNTGLVYVGFRRSSIPNQFNNPFMSRSNGAPRGFEFNPDYSLSLDEKVFHPNARGKVRLVPHPRGFHHFRLKANSHELPLFVNLNLGQTLLVANYLNESREPLPKLITLMRAKQNLENPELIKLGLELQTFIKLMADFTTHKLDPETFIQESYRDKQGKKEDFVEYLKIQDSSIQRRRITSGMGRIREKSIEITLAGTYQNSMESKQENYFCQLELNLDWKLKRYKLLKIGP